MADDGKPVPKPGSAADAQRREQAQEVQLVCKHDRLSVNPNVMFGKAVIRGTRIPVDLSLRKLGAGDDISEILADYPQLTVEDIRAARQFTASTAPCPESGGL